MGVVASTCDTPDKAAANVDLRTLCVVSSLISTIARTSLSDKSASVSSVNSVIFLLVAILLLPTASY